MIKHLDDILDIEVGDDEKHVFIVPENNNLHEIFFGIIKSGYEPRIKFQAGIITEMRIKLGETTYIIKTQNLVKTSADGCIAVQDEQTYNRMNETMFRFNKSLCNPLHKSFYNDIDIEILDETRAIAPVGLFWDRATLPRNIVEIDLCKASTKSIIDIFE